MHPNEIKITRENIAELFATSISLGVPYTEALLQQIGRQDVTVIEALKENSITFEELESRLNTI